jgi:hypothetical protein
MKKQPFDDDIVNSFRTDDQRARYASSGRRVSDGFRDKDEQFPLPEYSNQPSTNKAVRGGKANKVYLGGGDVTVNLGLRPLVPSQYPKNNVKKTITGHIVEIDDTPGNERMLYRHRTGSGIEMRADGTVIISSVDNTVRVTGGDEKVIVEGDGEISYNGNLTLNVTGDFDLKVGGNFNVVTSGDKYEETRGGRKDLIEKNFEQTIKKNRAEYTLGVRTETTLGDRNTITKGLLRNYVEGNIEQLSGGELIMTAESVASISSPNINIGAKSLTVIGDSGTIGGENIIAYNYNMYTGHSITAGDTISTTTVIASETMTSKEFIGSLTGNADTATQAGSAGVAGALGGGGSAGTKVTGTAASVDTRATVLTNNANMNSYLHASNFGVRQVDIDPGAVMKNQIDKSVQYGGVSARKLSTGEVRSKMRDPITIANKQFIGSMIAEGKLSPEYINAVPPKTGRKIGPEPVPRRSSKPIAYRLDTRRFT